MAGSAPLLRTVEFLCGRGNFGYAELDENYRSLWRHGALASWIPLGVNVCQQTDLFFGLEKELLDLQDEHGHCITLPRVGIPGVGDRADKISVEIYWDDQVAIYHVVIHRLVAESEVELELLKQIRARRLAEENFQATRETLARKQVLLDVIMEHLPVSAAIFDENQRFLFATRRWTRDFRIECERPLGQRLFEACPDIPGSQQELLEKTRAGLTTGAQIDALDRSASGVPGHRWTHQLWTHPEDGASGVLTVVEDVSDLAREKHELAISNEQLRSANRQLAHFASILSHDLSGPLRSLVSKIERQGDVRAPTWEEFGSCLRAHIDRMQNILAGMNEYMQVLSFEPVIKPVNVGQLVWEIIRTLPGGESFDVTLSLEVNAITVNPGMLDLVLRNLVENAIKHHDRESGHINIAVADMDEAWLITLHDDGPGIARGMQQILLEGRFESTATEFDGEGGKGLPIVVRALSGVGGSLQIESDPVKARGTRFLILWPKQTD
jgi:signal transduction histidine kinase